MWGREGLIIRIPAGETGYDRAPTWLIVRSHNVVAERQRRPSPTTRKRMTRT